MTGKSCFHAGRIALAMIAHPLHPDPSFLPIFSPWRSTVTKFADNQRENERRFHEFPAISNDRKAVDVGSRSRFPRFVVALSLLFYSSLKEKKRKKRKGIGREEDSGKWVVGYWKFFFLSFFTVLFIWKFCCACFFDWKFWLFGANDVWKIQSVLTGVVILCLIDSVVNQWLMNGQSMVG